MEVESRKELSDEIHWVKFSGISWAHDDSGIERFVVFQIFKKKKKKDSFMRDTRNQNRLLVKIRTLVEAQKLTKTKINVFIFTNLVFI